MLRAILATGVALLSGGSSAWADDSGSVGGKTRVVVTIENVAPTFGTSMTPFWVGFHEGEFDTYDSNTPASNDPQPGSVAMERLCEDGSTGPITQDFAELSEGVDATLAGPSGPIGPGEIVSMSFVLDPNNPNHRFFSYASMILPSNDFCVSNGSPVAHPIFDENGNFVAENFFVTGAEVLDAGTEVNDEIPENTAFFGQQTPNTGVDENGLIGTLGVDRPALGFMPPGNGGILDDPRFRLADFLVPGYSTVKMSFVSAPAVVDELRFHARLEGRSRGFGSFALEKGGDELSFSLIYTTLRGVTGASLSLGPDGPDVARLLPEDLGQLSRSERRRLRFYVRGSIDSQALVGPWLGQPLDVLSQALKEGRVYARIRTEAAPDGAVRGRVQLNRGQDVR